MERPSLPYDELEEYLDLRLEEDPQFLLHGFTWLCKHVKKHFLEPFGSGSRFKYNSKQVPDAVETYMESRGWAREKVRNFNIVTANMSREHNYKPYKKREPRVYKMPEEQRKRISEFMKGRPKSLEHRQKISEGLRKRYAANKY